MPALVASLAIQNYNNSSNRGTESTDNELLQRFQLQSTVERQQEVRRELVFVDTSAEDYEQLLEDLLSNADPTREIYVEWLDSSRDGIEQISQVLNNYDNLDAIHVVSHGTDGASSWATPGSAWTTWADTPVNWSVGATRCRWTPIYCSTAAIWLPTKMENC